MHNHVSSAFLTEHLLTKDPFRLCCECSVLCDKFSYKESEVCVHFLGHFVKNHFNV